MKKISELKTVKGDAYGYYNTSNDEATLFKKIFLVDDIIDRIKEPSRYFIIGEKGSGKTAYAVYLSQNSNDDSLFTSLKLVSNTVYDKFISMKSQRQLDMSSYKDVWKCILYLIIAEEVIPHIPKKFFGSGNTQIEFLKRAIDNFYYGAFSPEIPQAMEFTSRTEDSLNAMLTAGIFSTSGNTTNANSTKFTEMSYQLTLSKLIDGFTRAIDSITLDKKFTLFIDGIDARPTHVSTRDYMECLNGLVDAIIELNNSTLRQKNIKISLLIRPDILYSMSIHNMNQKISDNSVLVKWDTTDRGYATSRLFKIADNFLAKQQSINRVTGLTWKDYFPYETKNTNREVLDPFIDFLRYSLYKPRDILTILNKLVEKVSREDGRQNDTKFRQADFDDIIKEDYSSYLSGELKDYMLIYMNSNEFSIFQDFIRSFKTKSFSYSTFEKNFDSFLEKQRKYGKEIPTIMGTPNDALQLLYDANIIGYKKDHRFCWSFRERSYSNVRPDVEFNSEYKFHDGYARAFKIGH